MKKAKTFKIPASKIVQLIEPMGGCIATDKITVDGELIDYMYRDEPANDLDSGWRFQGSSEDQEYMDDSDNHEVYDVNTIANYEPGIIDYLHLPIGTHLERVKGTNKFKVV